MAAYNEEAIHKRMVRSDTILFLNVHFAPGVGKTRAGKELFQSNTVKIYYPVETYALCTIKV